jgi:hypothetical protein
MANKLVLHNCYAHDLSDQNVSKQKNNVTISAQMGVGMMIISVVMRMAAPNKNETPSVSKCNAIKPISLASATLCAKPQ